MTASALEGQTYTVRESFVDDFDDPLDIANTEAGPYVCLYDHEKALIVEATGYPDPNGEPGDWAADLAIPAMGLKESQEFRVVWTFKTSDDETHKVKQTLVIEPGTETRETDVLVVIGRTKKIQVVIPKEVIAAVPETPADPSRGKPAKPGKPGDRVVVSMFRNNQPLLGEDGLDSSDPSSGIMIERHIGSSTVTFNAVVGKPKVEAIALFVDFYKHGSTSPITYTFKVWPITPQVLVASSQLEDFINKARIENVIPELNYTQADLVQYLQRGLSLFNSYPPYVTHFDGTNMQGPIADAWLTCSAYYALGAQLQAEGALAFDFSGQTVSLNIDRTPAIESALGRIESAMSQQIQPLKKLLAKAGVLGGDGSDGGRPLNGAHHLGTLGISNAPTTRLPYAGHRGSWFRPLF